jgi:hypothetical protein
MKTQVCIHIEMIQRNCDAVLGVEELYNPFTEINIYYTHDYITIKTLFEL